MLKPITMRDMARELGLSRLTVSSIVNERAAERGISAATTERVRQYLRQRGYVPNRQAVSLQAGPREATGILHCGHLYSHVIEAFNLLTARFNAAPGGLEILVVRRPDLCRGVEELLARGVSRLVWLHILRAERELEDPVLLNYLARFETAAIYNYHFASPDNSKELTRRGIHLVGVDRAAGYARLARFLKDLGHSVVCLPDLAEDGGGPGAERVKAFAAEGLKAIGTLPRGTVPVPPRQLGALYAGSARAAMRAHSATAACLHDEESAGHMLIELARLGVRVPEDLTVTGYDGLPIGELLCKPLTTLAVPVAGMVDKAGALLSAGRASSRKRHCFDLELIPRATHGPVRGGGPRRTAPRSPVADLV